jgi:hypothetical protein
MSYLEPWTIVGLHAVCCVRCKIWLKYFEACISYQKVDDDSYILVNGFVTSKGKPEKVRET